MLHLNLFLVFVYLYWICTYVLYLYFKVVFSCMFLVQWKMECRNGGKEEKRDANNQSYLYLYVFDSRICVSATEVKTEGIAMAAPPGQWKSTIVGVAAADVAAVLKIWRLFCCTFICAHNSGCICTCRKIHIF